MMIFQLDSPEDTFLVVVIEKDNMDRMKQGNPITLNPASMGGFLEPVKHPNNLRLLIAYEEDSARLYELQSQGRTKELIEYVMRGYSFEKVDGKRFRGSPGVS
jgi:hypothetical protein